MAIGQLFKAVKKTLGNSHAANKASKVEAIAAKKLDKAEAVEAKVAEMAENMQPGIDSAVGKTLDAAQSAGAVTGNVAARASSAYNTTTSVVGSTAKWTIAKPIEASWKATKYIATRPFSWGKRALTSENKMIKYPAVASAGLAAAGTGAAIMARTGRNASELPPEMLETQAVLDNNDQVLNAMTSQQAMMQPPMMAQEAANQPNFQVSNMVPEGQLAVNEQELAAR